MQAGDKAVDNDAGAQLAPDGRRIAFAGHPYAWPGRQACLCHPDLKMSHHET